MLCAKAFGEDRAKRPRESRRQREDFAHNVVAEVEREEHAAEARGCNDDRDDADPGEALVEQGDRERGAVAVAAAAFQQAQQAAARIALERLSRSAEPDDDLLSPEIAAESEALP